MKKYIDTIWAVGMAVLVLSFLALGGCKSSGKSRIVDGPVVNCDELTPDNPLYRDHCIMRAF